MKNLNVIDLLVISLMVLAFVLGVIYFVQKPKTSGRQTLLTVRVNTSDPETILPEIKKTQTLYFDSTLNPVKQIGYKENTINGKVTSVDITIEGPGDISSDRYVFNGMRVLVNQKAELHGSYFAQGAITEVKYAN